MQWMVHGARADGPQPGAGRRAPQDPLEVVVLRPRPEAQEPDEPGKEHREERRRADDPALGERIDQKIVGMRKMNVAAGVIVLAGGGAPLLYALVRDELVAVQADAGPGIALPSDQSHPPDAVAGREH